MKVSLKKCMKQTAKDFKKNIINIIAASIYVFGMFCISSTLAVAGVELATPGKFDINNIVMTPLLTVITTLVFCIVWMPFIVGYVRYCICVSRKNVEIKNIMNPFGNRYIKRTIVMLGWIMILLLICTVGNIVAGVLFTVIYGLVPFIIADDKDFSILKVYTQSRKAVTKYLEFYVLILFLGIACILVSVATLGPGAIVAIPYFLITYAYLYRTTVLEEELNYSKVIYNITDVKEK